MASGSAFCALSSRKRAEMEEMEARNPSESAMAVLMNLGEGVRKYTRLVRADGRANALSMHYQMSQLSFFCFRSLFQPDKLCKYLLPRSLVYKTRW